MNGEYRTSKSYAMHYVFTRVWSENLQESDTDVRNQNTEMIQMRYFVVSFYSFSLCSSGDVCSTVFPCN